MSFSVDKILLPRYMNLSTDFREPPFRVAMSPFWLKHVLCFVCIHMEANATCCLLQTIQQRLWTKDCILFFPKKGDLRFAEDCWSITLTLIAAKIYNTLLFNHIEPEIEKILRKNQNSFLKKLIHNITDSDNQSNLRSLCKKTLRWHYL